MHLISYTPLQKAPIYYSGFRLVGITYYAIFLVCLLDHFLDDYDYQTEVTLCLLACAINRNANKNQLRKSLTIKVLGERFFKLANLKNFLGFKIRKTFINPQTSKRACICKISKNKIISKKKFETGSIGPCEKKINEERIKNQTLIFYFGFCKKK